jgi:hypothetical protein
MSGPSLKRETVTAPKFVVPLFLVVGVLQTMNRYLRIQLGSQTPHTDVRCCWRPLSEAVLAGTPLYVEPAVDNKPPLFELLNVAVAATGAYLLVFFLLVGTVNAAVGLLLWRICTQRDAPRVGLLAGGLFLVSVPLAGGEVINVRSFAIAGILLALSVRHPVARGAAVAAGGLFSQHAVFAVPALAYDRYRELDRPEGVRWVGVFALSGLGVVAGAFTVVYAVWGWASLEGAVYWTFLVAEQYTTNPTVPSLVGDTSEWLRSLYRFGLRHLLVLVPAGVGVWVTVTDDGAARTRHSTAVPVVTAALLAVSMTIPLFIRAYRAYWLYPLPFLALLAGVGIERLLGSGEA